MWRKSLIYWGIIFVLIGIFLQYQYAYFFFYQEQQQLFLLTEQYARDTIFVPGGTASYIAGFLQQFYLLTGGGAFLTSMLLVGIGWIGGNLLSHFSGKQKLWVNFISLLPVTGLLILHTSLSYRLAGTIALLMCLIGWQIYLKFFSIRYRWLLGVSLLSILYLLGGSVYFLFVLGLVVLEWVLNTKSPKYSLLTTIIYLVSCLGWVIISLLMHWTGDVEQIVLPDAYYEFSEGVNWLYYIWGFYLFSLLGGHWLQKKNFPLKWSIFLSAVWLGMCFYFVPRMQSKIQLYTYERDWYLRNHQWEQIIKTFRNDLASVQTLNVLNLALACRGELGDKMFSYPQDGVKTLLATWDNSLMSALICSDICYQVGDIASAQKIAFEGFVTSTNGNVRLLQRLVETNIICGSYQVAEKYIALLEKTLFYKTWAFEQRSYLTDVAVESNSEYASKRLSLQGQGTYAVSSNFVQTLKQLIDNDPQNTLAFQYLSGFLLLNRNLNAFRELYDMYYHSDIWSELSLSQQQAVVALEQDSPGNWAKMGVSLATEQAYGSFAQDLADKRGYINFVEEIAKNHGNTYWFYLLFKDRGGKK